jgi:hypothetical protein
MLILWLLEFLCVALLAAGVWWAAEHFIAHQRQRAQTRAFAQELMTFDEARRVILQHVADETTRGLSFEQATLTVLADDYLPGLSAYNNNKQ